MKNSLAYVAFAALLPALLIACGDDGSGMDEDAGTGGPDASTAAACPAMAPNPESLTPPCCYRESNAARLEAPELRITALDIGQPNTLGNALVGGIVQQALDGEAFNWLLRLDLSESAMLTTGFGRRNADSTFSFAMGDAPTPPDDASRWDPATFPVSAAGETITASYEGTVILPIISEDTVLLEIPMRSLELEATLSEDRTCIGTRRARGFDTGAGELQTFIEVEVAAAGRIDVDPINTYLCNFIADIPDSETPCTEIPRDQWSVLPDALCQESGCTAGECDPMTDCNAWTLTAGFSGAGVSITGG